MGRAGRHTPNRLRKHRLLMGLSQYEVAEKIGLKEQSLLSRWEHGNRVPDLESVIKLSILYGTLIDELYREFVQHLRDARQSDWNT